jgi:hypothetical protein
MAASKGVSTASVSAYRTISGASSLALAANQNRNGWAILADADNTDAVHVFLRPERIAVGDAPLTAAATTSHVALKAGQAFSDPIGSSAVFSGQVDVIVAAGTQKYSVVEY